MSNFRKTPENYISVITDFYSKQVKIMTEKKIWIGDKYKIIKKKGNHISILQATFKGMNVNEEKVTQFKKSRLGISKGFSGRP